MTCCGWTLSTQTARGVACLKAFKTVHSADWCAVQTAFSIKHATMALYAARDLLEKSAECLVACGSPAQLLLFLRADKRCCQQAPYN
jgi:hypothetical protein